MTSEYQIRVLPQVAANEQQLKAWQLTMAISDSA